ncbi:flagellar hook-length control protein FliK [Pseudoduganella armeniaca]|uniref:Flagellar hook-length control protein FliK n=1 Tax=Pseudoduganella armeniaca TaxID=2072590 RepID=A0A2R4CEZ2_9BURK|nr:flagellar hook-length control protein FliK [Pseudoduganella armeniaca]AVR98132.1 flagellar hook-length control protein FliK [Pseudoduganella armeniaca]
MQRLDTPGLRPLTPTGATQGVADPRQAAFQRALAPLVGQAVQGQVLAKMTDGSFLVRVADTNARMLLPAGVDVGADVPMTVVAAQPRALLQVGNEAAQTPIVHTQAGALPGQAGRPLSAAAALLGKAPLTPAEHLPELDRNTAQATLSPAARAIASALTQAYSAPGAPVIIHGKTPLAGAAGPQPEAMTKQLQTALGDSGLFYESHVAEWAEGKRPLQDLQREPQMLRAQAQAMQSPSEAAARALAGPDLSAAQMINQQLHTQEQGKVQWHGEAWPGQPMQWEVQREENEGRSRGGRDERDEAPVWRSGVKFRFPLLGKVAANVTMVGDQVHVTVQSDSDDTADTLRAWASVLQGALDAAGAPLASLSIGTETPAPGAADAT